MFGNYTNPYMNYGGTPVNPYAQNNLNFGPNLVPNTQQLNTNQNVGIKFVTEDEAKGYILMPNSQVLLMNKNEPIFYIKSSDSLGRSTLETYKFEKYDPETEKQKEVEKNELKLENYVTKEQLEQFISKDTFTKELSNVETKLGDKIEELKRAINIRKYLEGENKNV